LLRGLAFVAVFGMALHAFRSGVGVSDRPGLPGAHLLAHVYYTAGLFVLGGLDLGTPVLGSEAERGLLWSAYFLAPLITTSAVVEGALRLVGAGGLDRVGLHGHVVLVGLGRLASTFVGAMRTWDPECRIVAVDRDVQRASVFSMRREFGVRVFLGEAHIKSSLSAMRLQRARGIALLTDDDLLNLEVAYRLAREYPGLSVVAHVSDIGLQRAALDVDRTFDRVRVFNAHRSAAEQLYTDHLQPYFAGTQPRDTVVLAGFGRFGQALLELLEQRSADAIATVIVAEQHAESEMRSFRDQVDHSADFEARVVDGDLTDPRTWDLIRQAAGPLDVEPVIVVGTQHDSANLQAALQARRRWHGAPIVVRCQNESAFTEELARQRGFTVLAVNSMLKKALEQAQQLWFGPRG
jgi:voltage-gated potassium channel Kch